MGSDTLKPPPDDRPSRPRPRWTHGLSARLLALTGVFALIVEVLVLFPAASTFHERWLFDRIRAAEVASLAVEAAPYAMVAEDLAGRLLQGAGATTVVVQQDGLRRLLSDPPPGGPTPGVIDLRDPSLLARLSDPWVTLAGEDDRLIRVVAEPRFREGDFIEIVVRAEPLKRELGTYLLQIVLASLVIAGAAGALLYAALSYLVLRPVRRVTEAIERFRADPEAEPPALPRAGSDEIGRVEEELTRMQAEVRAALRSRARLAALGEGVAKISHDLRNMLTAAQMASDRLAASGDPTVERALPRLERALDRALGLAQNVLNYGRSEEPAPNLRPVRVAPAIDAAAEDAGLTPGGVRLSRRAPARLHVEADADQLHRILVNLMRNAREAIEADPERAGRGRVRVTAQLEDGQVAIRVRDDGPGLPERVRERLFEPFVGSGRPGGAGLGLAIARELAEAQGGELALEATGPEGATFRLRLPAAHS